MSVNSEIKELRDACAALSLPNQKRAYEVACALQFAAETPVKAARPGLTGNDERSRRRTKRAEQGLKRPDRL